MPAKSKAQQALFGMALAVRKGELEKSKVNKEVLDIVNSDMTNKEIEDFASTSRKGLKDHVHESLLNGLEKVFVVIKPGFLDRYSDILHMLEERGFILRDTCLKKLTMEEAQELYKPHENEDFYNDLCTYMSSDYSLGLVFSTFLPDPIYSLDKVKEDIRNMWSIDEMRNVIHSSDSTHNVTRESAIYF